MESADEGVVDEGVGFSHMREDRHGIFDLPEPRAGGDELVGKERVLSVRFDFDRGPMNDLQISQACAFSQVPGEM